MRGYCLCLPCTVAFACLAVLSLGTTSAFAESASEDSESESESELESLESELESLLVLVDRYR